MSARNRRGFSDCFDSSPQAYVSRYLPRPPSKRASKRGIHIGSYIGHSRRAGRMNTVTLLKYKGRCRRAEQATEQLVEYHYLAPSLQGITRKREGGRAGKSQSKEAEFWSTRCCTCPSASIVTGGRRHLAVELSVSERSDGYSGLPAAHRRG